MSRHLDALCGLSVVLGLVAVGCSDRGDWSSVDRNFVARMIPHHHLGMELIDEVTVHSGDVRLRRLVFEMSGYHVDEMARLEQWADQQHIATAASFPGDLPATEVGELSALDGAAHDIRWLDLMIRHHRGALVIADDAIDHGAVADVRDMAASVRSVQTDEITSMTELLTTLCDDIESSPLPEGCGS